MAEYDVSILSAEESDGLIRWLTDNGYKIPPGAEPVIGSYIKQKMHFFVAKVNVKRMQQLGRAYLRPLQVRYETAKFMLPLRLGTVNANGPQDLIVYALIKRGRVEATNYRTVKVPSGFDVPLFVKDDFANFYKATFDRAVVRENMRGVFVEYAWDMGWCDPCAAEPMTNEELGGAWGAVDRQRRCRRQSTASGGTGNAYVTRLHVRYDAKTFPEDLNFIETGDRENFQGRYILQHPFTAATSCPAAEHLPRLASGAVQEGSGKPGRRHRLAAEGHRGAHGVNRPAYVRRQISHRRPACMRRQALGYGLCRAAASHDREIDARIAQLEAPANPTRAFDFAA